jgi:hypothetical protein
LSATATLPHPDLHLMLDQQPQHRVDRAQLLKQVKHQADHGLDLLVGVEGDLARGSADIPGRQRERQLPTAGLGQPTRRHPLLDQMQLHLRHRALQPEQETVVVPVRIVDAVTVGQQRPGQATQLDQLVPVPPGPGQPRHVQAQHQANMPHRDFGNQPGEPGPRRRVRRRPPQILVDHQHPRRRPPQRRRPLDEAVLQPRRLAMVNNLLTGRLAHINHRQTITVPALDLLPATLSQQHHAHRRLRRSPGPAQPPTAPAACSGS